MAGFFAALQRRDVNDFLKYFSQVKSFGLISKLEKPNKADVVTYQWLARDLLGRDPDRGWYSTLFDGGPDPAFADAVEALKLGPWKLVSGHKFVPPDDNAKAHLFVVWRKEQGRWVVDAIGYPSA